MKLKITKASAVMTCEPTTIATITGAMIAISAGATGYSMYASGQSQQEAMNYNASVEKMKADDAMQRGADEAAERRDRARKIAASQAEGAAMSGVRVDTGTPLDLQTETAGLGELDALRTMNNARRQAWGNNAQSELDVFQGKSAYRAGILNAGSTFLGSASNMFSTYRKATA